ENAQRGARWSARLRAPMARHAANERFTRDRSISGGPSQMRSTQWSRLGALVAIVQLIAACAGSAVGTSTWTPTATAPVITIQPTSQAVTAGQPATFTVAALGTTPLLYQWNRNGSAIPGATAASYTITATSATD